ncbi:MAG: hypothetical protein ACTSXX_13105 [Candidatus Baldrarchaeia archaeon]
MEVSLEVLVFLGVFWGVFLRTIFPWIRKVSQGKLNPPVFDKKYAGSAVAATLWIWKLMLEMIRMMNPPDTEFVSMCIILITFFSGWFGVDFQNELAKVREFVRKVEQIVQQPPQPQPQQQHKQQ